jgi:hypothetical protein
MAYLNAFVYHCRKVEERDGLRDALEQSIKTQAIQKEVRGVLSEVIQRLGER